MSGKALSAGAPETPAPVNGTAGDVGVDAVPVITSGPGGVKRRVRTRSIHHRSNVVFVCTDMESSTAMAAANAVGVLPGLGTLASQG